jgi:orotate phosphoribosyltransferase
MLAELTPAQIALFNTLHVSNGFQIDVSGFRYKMHERYPDLPLAPTKIQVRDNPPFKSGYFFPLCNSFGWAIAENILQTKIDLSHIDALVGVPEVGNHLAQSVSRELVRLANVSIPVFQLEKENLADGTRRVTNNLHGDFHPGQRVIIIEDVMSTAASTDEAERGVTNNGLYVVHRAAGVDRELTGLQRLRNDGKSVSVALPISQFYERSLAERRSGFTEEVYEKCIEFDHLVRERILADTA